ncbi:MAG TPA: ATP-binding protein [Candidatus Acidoferrum sp.]|nr:ATP-binding protein [Candidatus Acidoferrum sp.]
MWTAVLITLTLALGIALIISAFRRRVLESQLDVLRREKDSAAADQRAIGDQARAERQTLFNSMVEGVALLDATGRIQLVNRSLEKQFELTVDVRGQTLMEAFRRPELAQLLQRLASDRSVLSIEIEVLAREPRWFEVNAATVFDRQAQPQGAILVFHDLTRIRQLENTRREFVANVSHELRTPLSLIKGYVETLLDGGAREDPELTTKFLRTIERHSNRLTNLIEDLLTISRLESGQITLQLRAVPLRSFVEHLLSDLHARATERGVTIENQLAPELQGRADPDRLEQVLVNLLDNAIKYGRAGGRVEVRGRALAEQVELCVADDGPGIPAEAKERIFERFYRVDRARSRETGGTGLGLAIVKHIVQSHGGKVWVESEPCKGTLFYLTLPHVNGAPAP